MPRSAAILLQRILGQYTRVCGCLVHSHTLEIEAHGNDAINSCTVTHLKLDNCSERIASASASIQPDSQSPCPCSTVGSVANAADAPAMADCSLVKQTPHQLQQLAGTALNRPQVGRIWGADLVIMPSSQGSSTGRPHGSSPLDHAAWRPPRRPSGWHLVLIYGKQHTDQSLVAAAAPACGAALAASAWCGFLVCGRVRCQQGYMLPQSCCTPRRLATCASGCRLPLILMLPGQLSDLFAWT